MDTKSQEKIHVPIDDSKEKHLEENLKITEDFTDGSHNVVLKEEAKEGNFRKVVRYEESLKTSVTDTSDESLCTILVKADKTKKDVCKRDSNTENCPQEALKTSDDFTGESHDVKLLKSGKNKENLCEEDHCSGNSPEKLITSEENLNDKSCQETSLHEIDAEEDLNDSSCQDISLSKTDPEEDVNDVSCQVTILHKTDAEEGLNDRSCQKTSLKKTDTEEDVNDRSCQITSLRNIETEEDLREENVATSENKPSVKWKTIADTINEQCTPVIFKWKIENFSALPKEVDTFYESPEFHSPGFSWCLRLYPNGLYCQSSEDWIGLYIKICSGSYIHIHCVVGIVNVNGTKEFLNGMENIYFGTDDVKGWERFLQMDELVQRKRDFYPSDTLTVYIWLQHATPNHLKTVTLPVKIGNIKIGGPWKKKSEDKGLNLLSDNFRKLLLDEEYSDLTINVKGEIFNVHKLILKTRSLMLFHGMAEEDINVIEIEDCEPEAFAIFLMYLYTGKVQKLSDANMLDVYFVADKYGVQDLKAECELYIKCSMSVKNVSDIIDVARNHDDTDLLNCALDYFIENVQEVVLTEEWKSFLNKEPKYGQMLYEKAIKKRKV